MKEFLENLKFIQWKDPMIIILAGLLVFLTAGTSIKGCTEMNKEKHVICIDAAFGKDLKGYEGIVNEADVTKAVADELVKLLEADRQYTVITTSSNETVSQRVETIADSEATLVLSIHAGGSPDSSLSGMRNSVMKNGDAHAQDSRKFASCLENAFKDSTSVSAGIMLYEPLDDGMYAEKYEDVSDTTTYTWDTWTIMNCGKTTVVSDFCHVTSQKDVDHWCSEEGYKEAASLYYSAIQEYYGTEGK